MARHRVPEQALRNFFSILIGFLLGAANNLVVLPWAFEGSLDTWGLVRIAAAWATLLSPLLVFGAPAAMNKFKGTFDQFDGMAQLNGATFRAIVALFAVFVALPSILFPETVADILDMKGSNRGAVRPIAILAGIQAGQVFFSGYLSTRLKTAFATFARESLFKFGYLALGIAVGSGWLAKDAFLSAFVGLHILILAVLFAQSWANQFKVSLRGVENRELAGQVRRYGGTMMLGGSALIVLSQIDVILVGRLMGLEDVPRFTIAVFIATVTGIPLRTFQRLLQPLVSTSLFKNDNRETWRLMGLTHRNMLLVGGWILTCIWVSMPEIDLLLPEPFRGLKWVVLSIGIARVMQGAASGTNILLGQSDHYRHTILLNWMTVILALPLNFIFIPETALGLGLLGAALATLAATTASVLARQWVVWRIWSRTVPDWKTLLILLVLFLPAVSLVHWTPTGPAVLLLLLKSGAVTAWVACCAWRLDLAPEAMAQATKKWPWLAKGQ